MEHYKDYRKNIKSGDLLAWTSNGFSYMSILGQIVRIFTRSEYSHVAVAWWSGNRLFMIEAIPPQVRIYPLGERLPFFHIPMNIDWKEGYADYLLERVGEPYSMYEAVKAFLSKPDNNSTWECAELCNRFYKNIGIDFGNSNVPSTLVMSALNRNNSSLVYVNN